MKDDFKIYAITATVRPVSNAGCKFKPAFNKLRGTIIDSKNLNKEDVAEYARQELIKCFVRTPSPNVDSYDVKINEIVLCNKHFIFHTEVS